MYLFEKDQRIVKIAKITISIIAIRTLPTFLEENGEIARIVKTKLKNLVL
ncbi:hypothetical protein PRO82_002217 [Candidatus Protochlamydia amoebophila]|nr:hypothetical protein [Candidatus Protochlamydia amoebophila]